MPVLLVHLVLINFLFQGLVMEVKRILTQKHFMHDNTQGKHIIFICVLSASFVVLRCAERHGESGFMIYIILQVLSNSGWQDYPKSINFKLSLLLVMIFVGLRSRCATLYSVRQRRPWAMRMLKKILVWKEIERLNCLQYQWRLGEFMKSARRSFQWPLSFQARRQY